MTRRESGLGPYSYHYTEPEEFSGWDKKEITKTIARLFPKRAPLRERFFGVTFPTMEDSQHIVFTELLRDACNVLSGGGRLKISRELDAPTPDGKELVEAGRISDQDWDTLAEQACYRKLVTGPTSKRGLKLAGEMAGARFRGGKQIGDIFVLSDTLANVDVFVRFRGKVARRVVHLPSPRGRLR